MFVVLWLLLSYIFDGLFVILGISLAVIVGVNVAVELTTGKKYWVKSAKTLPRRSVKQVLRELFLRAFARDKTKGYVFAGIMILMMSFFVKLNAYYIIFACAVFIFAMLTRFASPTKCATISNNENSDKNGGEEPACDKGLGETAGGTPPAP
jgi:hypothetical protein